ncbi:MAG: DNA-binding protein, partial [Planctomycetota bacterium]
MEKKFYTTDEAAKILGLTPAEVNSMRERNELRGFRDGMDWKFKVEDVEALVRQRRQDAVSSTPSGTDEGEKAPSETDEIVLMGDDLSTFADSDASGTVIGSTESSEGEGVSDIKLGGSDLDLLDESDFASVEMDAKVNGFGQSEEVGDAEPIELEAAEAGDSAEELDLAATDSGEAAESKPDSSLDLSPGAEMEDDDLVLGGSGGGSDITLSSDSGISLLDSNDSGISLEDPLELAPVDESLELGEDDILTIAEDADTESPTQLKTDDEFLLTPLEEVSEDESASGSQVIALDTDVPVDVAGAGAQPAGVLGGMQPPGT